MVTPGELLWTPPPARVRDATLTRYLGWLAATSSRAVADHDELWRWSVDDLDGFWASIWDFFQAGGGRPAGPVLAER
ncbi:MAG: acetoacetate--CoA ligase, partial [Actinomycetes bacterium]